MRHITVICLLLLGMPLCLKAAGLDDLATVRDMTSHRSSSHDRTGGNDDNVMSFAPGATHVMLDTDGPGRITHIWVTVSNFRNHETFLRDLVIRMTWDHASVPAVEVPLGDFFALGHGKRYAVQSIPVAVGINERAMNCYWPMPFRKHAKIEIYNNGRRSIRRIYFNIDYELGPILENQGLFHAMFRREKALKSQAHTANTTGKDNYVILETTGRGNYVGCVLFVDSQPGGWWGEGDEMIFIDHAELPTIIGTGSEDYFCNAWGYSEPFSYPFYGAPLLEEQPDKNRLTTVYRWHIQDPMRFARHIKVTIEHLFKEGVVNDYSSAAYWYQTEPITKRDPLPAAEANHPRIHTEPSKATSFEVDGTELEPALQAQRFGSQSITAGYGEGYQNGGYLRVDPLAEQVVGVGINVPEDGRYRVEVKLVNKLISDGLRIGLNEQDLRPVVKHARHEGETPYLDLGIVDSENKRIRFLVKSSRPFGIDHLKISRID